MAKSSLSAFFIIFLNIFVQLTESTLTFDWCCELGRRNSVQSRLCLDYTSITPYHPTSVCKLAFTICCNQNTKNEECERGKLYAHQQESCYDPSKTISTCDAFMDCCNCCQMGIQTAKTANENCISRPGLSDQCNQIYLDCCNANRHQQQPQTQQVQHIHQQVPEEIRHNPRDITETAGDACLTSAPCPSGQVCQISNGEPVCVCEPGFEMETRTRNCIDIDECKDENKCPFGSVCENTVGSYKCSRTCGIGYIYDSSTSQCKDINECAMSIHRCPIGMRCENIPGSYRCIREIPCGTGYSIDSFTQDCIDIDECALNLHDCKRGFNCVNLQGTFKCEPQECPLGFIFNYNDGACEPIRCNPGYINHNITRECVDLNECDLRDNACRLSEKCVNTPGSYRCVELLTCERGYELNADKDACIDIDECSTRRHTCPSNARCINRNGGFTCICPTGYELDVTSTRCDDIDECSYGHDCPRQSSCVNTVGSYECKCNTGFQLIEKANTKYCQDIDECKTPYICQHKCVNTFGSFQCICHEGFTLASDKRSCLDIDECQARSNMCSNGVCVNTPGSFECTCGAGFQVDRSRGRVCMDIDECKLGTHNCHFQERCINIIGSFKCLNVSCPSGYYLAGGSQSTRCDRTNTICRSDDSQCYRQPMKIFHHYVSFPRTIAIPAKIITTTPIPIRLQYRGRQSTRYGLKFISTTVFGPTALMQDDILMRYPGLFSNGDTFMELMLVKQPQVSQEVKLEISVEVYHSSEFQASFLNRVFLYITD